jgi:diacylglycerol O-acyltransferase
MSERLRARDLAVLAGESPTTPRHNATVEVFEPGESGFDYARLVELVADRISFVPRYRQRLAPVPGRLANPVWVDDPDFDIGYHVRRSALPRPGSPEQLFELVGRIVSRPLDRHRPLWEVYLVEGLEGGRLALLSKAHEVLVDGVHTVDLAQVLLDRTAEPRPFHQDDWHPLSAPSPAGLVAGAVQDAVTDP